jgi:hypothetical protein
VGDVRIEGRCGFAFPGRLAGVTPLQGFPPLVIGQLRLPAHLHPASFGQFPPLAGARADQLAFKFSQLAQDGEHQAAMRGGGVGPGIIQGPESDLSVGNAPIRLLAGAESGYFGASQGRRGRPNGKCRLTALAEFLPIWLCSAVYLGRGA